MASIHRNTPPPRTSFFEFLSFVAVFAVVLATSKLGEYLFFSWDTAPAYLWPTTGIAMAILWLCGYRYIIPISIGLALSFATGPLSDGVIPTLLRVAGHLIAYVTFVELLKRIRFDRFFSNLGGMLRFLVAAMAVSNIPSFFDILMSTITQHQTIASYLPVSFAWAGHLLSILIFFPLIVLWMSEDEPTVQRPFYEIALTEAMLFFSLYFLFWTPVRLEYIFIFFSLLFVSFFWIGFRFSTRALASSLAAATIFGLVGLFVSPAPDTIIGEQLFVTELFLFLIIPIFYTTSALVKERAQTIEKLRNAMENIERENVAKNEFIAVLAHELRNPLAPIKSTLEILSLGELEPDIQDLVTRARQQVKAMQRLLSDLLDITRVTQGKFQLRISQVDLCELVRQCIESTRYVFKDRGHTISLDTNWAEALTLAVDPVRFEQVLVNILMNAAKYTESGGVIRVSMHIIDGRVQIRVTDNGVGIEKENLEKVFEPFWQMKKAGVNSLSGIGVGLWLTKRIVEMHGGTITAESEGQGKGSTFIITIPILVVEIPTMVQEQKKVTHLPKYRILVGDDNKPATDSLIKLLTMKGHETHAAYSGQEVLDATEVFKPQIILLDIGLQDMTGYVVAQKLRAQGFTDKIIALTGYGQEEDRKEAANAGFDFHFTKPMSIDTFEKYLASF